MYNQRTCGWKATRVQKIQTGTNTQKPTTSPWKRQRRNANTLALSRNVQRFQNESLFRVFSETTNALQLRTFCSATASSLSATTERAALLLNRHNHKLGPGSQHIKYFGYLVHTIDKTSINTKKPLFYLYVFVPTWTTGETSVASILLARCRREDFATFRRNDVALWALCKLRNFEGYFKVEISRVNFGDISCIMNVFHEISCIDLACLKMPVRRRLPWLDVTGTLTATHKSKLPELSWKEESGAKLLFHYRLTGWQNGKASTFRERKILG